MQELKENDYAEFDALVAGAQAGDEVAMFGALDWLREHGEDRAADVLATAHRAQKGLPCSVGEAAGPVTPRRVGSLARTHFQGVQLRDRVERLPLDAVPLLDPGGTLTRAMRGRLCRKLFRDLGVPHVTFRAAGRRQGGPAAINVVFPTPIFQDENRRLSKTVRAILGRAFPRFVDAEGEHFRHRFWTCFGSY